MSYQIFSHITNATSIVTGILGIIIGIIGLRKTTFQEVHQVFSEEITVRHASNEDETSIFLHNQTVKRRIIWWSTTATMLAFFLITIWNTWEFTYYINEINGPSTLSRHIQITVLRSFITFLTYLGITTLPLALFATTKYIITKKIRFKKLSVFSYGSLFLTSIYSISNIDIIHSASTAIILEHITSDNGTQSLFEFFRVISGTFVISTQILTFMFITHHLIENLLLRENHSSLLDQNIKTISIKILFPILVLFFTLFWKYI